MKFRPDLICHLIKYSVTFEKIESTLSNLCELFMQESNQEHDWPLYLGLVAIVIRFQVSFCVFLYSTKLNLTGSHLGYLKPSNVCF